MDYDHWLECGRGVSDPPPRLLPEQRRTHDEIIADLNASMLLVSAVGRFDETCLPVWGGTKWHCGCLLCQIGE